MIWGEGHPRWLLFAGEVLISAREFNEEHRRKMSVEVKGLAETVRKAKDAIRTASTAASRMSDSATRVVNTVAQVEAMTKQLDAANDDLTAALGTMTNGGPPLDDGGSSQSATLNVDQAASVVADANSKPAA
jgi:prophage DNA circulation protein